MCCWIVDDKIDDRPGQKLQVLFRCQPAQVTNDEGILRDLQLPTKCAAIAIAEIVQFHPGGDHPDRRGNATLQQQVTNTLTGSENLITEVGITGGQLNDKTFQRRRIPRHIVGILLIKGMMSEHQRQLAMACQTQGREAEQKRMLGMNDVGSKIINRFAQMGL